MKYKVTCEFLVPKSDVGNPSVSFNIYNYDENLYHSSVRPFHHMEMYIGDHGKAIILKFDGVSIYHFIPSDGSVLANTVREIATEELKSYLERIRAKYPDSEFVLSDEEDSEKCFDSFVIRSMNFIYGKGREEV